MASLKVKMKIVLQMRLNQKTKNQWLNPMI